MCPNSLSARGRPYLQNTPEKLLCCQNGALKITNTRRLFNSLNFKPLAAPDFYSLGKTPDKRIRNSRSENQPGIFNQIPFFTCHDWDPNPGPGQHSYFNRIDFPIYLL